MCDMRFVCLLLCGAVFIVPHCNATCNITDAKNCLPGIFTSQGIYTFRCSRKSCIDNLRSTCVGSPSYCGISEIAELFDYTCTTEGQIDSGKLPDCLNTVATQPGGVARLNAFGLEVKACVDTFLSQLGSSASAMCRAAAGTFNSCMVFAFNAVCPDLAARRFWGKYADLVEVSSCLDQYRCAASIPYITKLSMAVWAGILTFFFI